jgi:MFS superfamily sulfate permease-like transporter
MSAPADPHAHHAPPSRLPPAGRDLLSGVTLAALLLPEAVAYSAMAGLTADRAILAAIGGCLAYGLVGRSRVAILAPTSSSAAILAAMLAAMPTTISGDPAERGAFATMAVLMVGGLFLAAGLLRLGGLTNLVPRPVLKGFAVGIALTIIARQLPVIAGLRLSAPDPARLLDALWLARRDWNGWSVAVGLGALALFVTLRCLRMPAALTVLLAGIVLSALMGLGGMGVGLVGAIGFAPGWPSLPQIASGQLALLASYVVPLFLILLAESWGTVTSLARPADPTPSSNRELLAFGAANLTSGLLRGLPVGAGFSAGAAADASGARSRLAGVFAALLLVGLMLFARGTIAMLPLPVLAAVVIGTLLPALNPAPFVRLWRLGRDLPIALIAALSVLGFGVLNGMLIAITLSLGLLFRRLSEARVARLGRLGDTHNYVDMARHPDAVAPPATGIWRPSEPLFYGNAASVLSAIRSAVRHSPGDTARHVVLSLEETFDLDSTTFDALVEFEHALQGDGRSLWLARVHDHVRDVLAAGGEAGLLARSSYSVADAVAAIARGQDDTPKDPPDDRP